MGSKEKIPKTRTSEDLPMPFVIGSWVVIFLFLCVYQSLNLAGVTGAVLTVVFSFFFVTVSSRIVGIVGTSSMPLSGMTIGALLITCLVVQSTGLKGAAGIGAALVVGAMICIAIAMGGDISQDLKIGFLVGASPKWVQVTQLISVLVSSATVCVVVSLLGPLVVNGDLKAPQANLMFLVSQGVLEGNLPWVPVCIGMAVAACVEMMGIGSLPFAVGLYLPLELSTTLAFGGLLNWAFHRFTPEKLHKGMYDHGLLLCSGMVAGDALTGLVMAGLSAYQMDTVLSRHFQGLEIVKWDSPAWIAFSALMAFLIYGLLSYLRTAKAQTDDHPTAEPDQTIIS